MEPSNKIHFIPYPKKTSRLEILLALNRFCFSFFYAEKTSASQARRMRASNKP